ncbi:MAG: hypothetical protein HN337_04270 [Deltaproteobacteria bacterium]|jgi:hypothetical protein|nr:hypothetical protein [Deltaproteobacteria bacterium]
MKMAHYTKQERAMILTMRILMIAFFTTAILFALLPNYTLNYISDIGRVMFSWYSPNVHTGQVHFWLIPTVSFLLALSYLCAVVQKDPAQHIEYVRLILITTFASAVGFAVYLFSVSWQFFYLVGAITNALIFIITVALYSSATRSRNRWTTA